MEPPGTVVGTSGVGPFGADELRVPSGLAIGTKEMQWD